MYQTISHIYLAHTVLIKKERQAYYIGSVFSVAEATSVVDYISHLSGSYRADKERAPSPLHS